MLTFTSRFLYNMAMSFSRAPEELPVYRKHAIETLKAPSELPVTGDSYGVYSNFGFPFL
jgi:hypothetical protein